MKVNDYFPNCFNPNPNINDGIIKLISKDQSVTIPQWFINYSVGGSVEFHTKFTLDREASVMLETFYTEQPELYQTLIAQILALKYMDKWNKLYETTQLEYNPIWNVDATEERIITRELDTSKNETDSNTRNTTINSDATENSVYAFNSTEAVPSNNVSHTGSQTETDGNTHTATNRDVETTTDSFTRGGNIGVTTTQHMIEEERKVVDFIVWDTIYRDIASELCAKYW